MRVAAVLVNWKNWADTLECLEGVFRTDPAPAVVIVCDNDSRDGSVDRVLDWARGRLDVYVTPDHPLRCLTLPPVPKPIRVQEPHELDAPADRKSRTIATAAGTPPSDAEGPDPDRPGLVVIEVGVNGGFAAGANAGIRYALGRPDLDAVWLLNNDTVVTPAALGEMVSALEASPGAGMCGSTLLYYDRPGVVQALAGGTYNSWLGLPKHLGEGAPITRRIRTEDVVARLAFVTAASMLVRREFIEEVGLMEEDYFLYFEELDWALRGADRYTLAYAPESIVFHKEGRAIGTLGPARKSIKSDRYFLGNRVKITRRFFPGRLPFVRLALLVAMVKRVRRGQWDRVRMIYEMMMRG